MATADPFPGRACVWTCRQGKGSLKDAGGRLAPAPARADPRPSSGNSAADGKVPEPEVQGQSSRPG